jgi:hypothetical protein
VIVITKRSDASLWGEQIKEPPRWALADGDERPVATGSLHPAAQLFGPVHCPTKFIRRWAMCAQLLPVEHIPGH